MPPESHHPFKYTGIDKEMSVAHRGIVTAGHALRYVSVSVEFESVAQDSVGSASIALRCFSSSGLW